MRREQQSWTRARYKSPTSNIKHQVTINWITQTNIQILFFQSDFGNKTIFELSSNQTYKQPNLIFSVRVWKLKSKRSWAVNGLEDRPRLQLRWDTRKHIHVRRTDRSYRYTQYMSLLLFGCWCHLAVPILLGNNRCNLSRCSSRILPLKNREIARLHQWLFQWQLQWAVKISTEFFPLRMH